MMLSATAIKSAKPADKPYRMADEKGLYLLVQKNGSKWWRLDYRIHGVRKTISLGVYPDIGLKEARDLRDEARKQVALGTDPSELRKADKESRVKSREEAAAQTEMEQMIAAGVPLPGSFKAVALEWFAKQEPTWARSHSGKILRQFERDIFPYIGNLQISEITAPAVLAVLERIERRGTADTAHRAKQNIGQVMRYAVATGRTMYDPTPSLRGALAPIRKQHFAALTEPEEIAGLLRVMDGYRGSPIVKSALRIAPLVFVRPGELRHMQWADIDLDKSLWKFIASKTNQAHIVPLSTQVIEALQELHLLTGGGKYVFPSTRSQTRPMSENTVNAALKRLGIDTQKEITGHGFRAMARTVLAEHHDYPAEVIEMQLAHAVRDPLGRAYNRTQHIKQRTQMMQVWADYLDEIRQIKGS